MPIDLKCFGVWISLPGDLDGGMTGGDHIRPCAAPHPSQKRGTKVIGMNVVIQHMVKADYAGVAFSVSPIEKDKRIMLIELVKGTGDALVSGKVTPTTIRYNKLTRSHRIEQTGADPIDGGIITAILDELVPLLLTIEEAYGHPVDVEWAVDNEKVYILQARPITT